MLFLKTFYSHEVPEALEFLLIYLTYFRLCWDIIPALGLSLVAVSLLVAEHGFGAWAQQLWCRG